MHKNKMPHITSKYCICARCLSVFLPEDGRNPGRQLLLFLFFLPGRFGRVFKHLQFHAHIYNYNAPCVKYVPIHLPYKFKPNTDKYSIHQAYGIGDTVFDVTLMYKYDSWQSLALCAVALEMMSHKLVHVAANQNCNSHVSISLSVKAFMTCTVICIG